MPQKLACRGGKGELSDEKLQSPGPQAMLLDQLAEIFRHDCISSWRSMALIKRLARNELAWTGSIRLLTELMDQVDCGAPEKTMGKQSNNDKKSKSTPESATQGSGVDGKSKI